MARGLGAAGSRDQTVTVASTGSELADKIWKGTCTCTWTCTMNEETQVVSSGDSQGDVDEVPPPQSSQPAASQSVASLPAASQPGASQQAASQPEASSTDGGAAAAGRGGAGSGGAVLHGRGEGVTPFERWDPMTHEWTEPVRVTGGRVVYMSAARAAQYRGEDFDPTRYCYRSRTFDNRMERQAVQPDSEGNSDDEDHGDSSHHVGSQQEAQPTGDLSAERMAEEARMRNTDPNVSFRVITLESIRAAARPRAACSSPQTQQEQDQPQQQEQTQQQQQQISETLQEHQQPQQQQRQQQPRQRRSIDEVFEPLDDDDLERHVDRGGPCIMVGAEEQREEAMMRSMLKEDLAKYIRARSVLQYGVVQATDEQYTSLIDFWEKIAQLKRAGCAEAAAIKLASDHAEKMAQTRKSQQRDAKRSKSSTAAGEATAAQPTDDEAYEQPQLQHNRRTATAAADIDIDTHAVHLQSIHNGSTAYRYEPNYGADAQEQNQEQREQQNRNIADPSRVRFWRMNIGTGVWTEIVEDGTDEMLSGRGGPELMPDSATSTQPTNMGPARNTQPIDKDATTTEPESEQEKPLAAADGRTGEDDLREDLDKLMEEIDSQPNDTQQTDGGGADTQQTAAGADWQVDHEESWGTWRPASQPAASQPAASAGPRQDAQNSESQLPPWEA